MLDRENGSISIVRYTIRVSLLRGLRPSHDRWHFPLDVIEDIILGVVSNPMEELLMNPPPTRVIMPTFPSASMYHPDHPLYASVRGQLPEHDDAEDERLAVANEGMEFELDTLTIRIARSRVEGEAAYVEWFEEMDQWDL